MKGLLAVALFCFCTPLLQAQVVHCPEKEPDPGFSNIFSSTLFSDSLVSSFMIWIRSEVPPHLHEHHSEHVYVLEGSGEMILGDSSFTIRRGDFIFIPAGTLHAVKVSSASPVKVLSIQAPEFDGSDRKLIPQKD